MTRTTISPEDLTALLNAGLLTDMSVTPARSDPFIDPRCFKDGTWREHAETRVFAILCGTPVEDRFDRNEIGSDSKMLEKMIAACHGEAEPEATPTEEQVVHRTLARACTAALPKLSNHAQLRIEATLAEPN